MVGSIPTTFPSPVGELHFSINFTYISEDYTDGFRPLSGNYISQSIPKLVKAHNEVSVPCRGTTFLNDTSGSHGGKAFSFRPLSGNYISQRTTCLYTALLKVSVPCRGTTFLKITSLLMNLIKIQVSVPCRGTTFLNIWRTLK